MAQYSFMYWSVILCSDRKQNTVYTSACGIYVVALSINSHYQTEQNESSVFIIKLDQTKVSKGAKIGNRYNQIPHLTQDTNWKVTNSQLSYS